MKDNRIFWLVLTFAWIGVIGTFSSVPYSFEQTASWFGAWNLEVRKLAHILEYGLLTFLWFKFWHVLPWALASAVLCAAVDEYYQSFIPGRGSSIQDVLVDSLGIVTVGLWLKTRKSGNEGSA